MKHKEAQVKRDKILRLIETDVSQSGEWVSRYKRIPDLPMEELPELLVHKSQMVRYRARKRMLELQDEVFSNH